jgi:hypothetical protein|tara:strand:+ start:176 stop:514 length:339 start_codon:yes stop_codon:yes gene_type:complete
MIGSSKSRVFSDSGASKSKFSSTSLFLLSSSDHSSSNDRIVSSEVFVNSEFSEVSSASKEITSLEVFCKSSEIIISSVTASVEVSSDKMIRSSSCVCVVAHINNFLVLNIFK